jgi:hypothetical protein
LLMLLSNVRKEIQRFQQYDDGWKNHSVTKGNGDIQEDQTGGEGCSRWASRI